MSRSHVMVNGETEIHTEKRTRPHAALIANDTLWFQFWFFSAAHDVHHGTSSFPTRLFSDLALAMTLTVKAAHSILLNSYNLHTTNPIRRNRKLFAESQELPKPLHG